MISIATNAIISSCRLLHRPSPSTGWGPWELSPSAYYSHYSHCGIRTRHARGVFRWRTSCRGRRLICYIIHITLHIIHYILHLYYLVLLSEWPTNNVLFEKKSGVATCNGTFISWDALKRSSAPDRGTDRVQESNLCINSAWMEIQASTNHHPAHCVLCCHYNIQITSWRSICLLQTKLSHFVP